MSACVYAVRKRHLDRHRLNTLTVENEQMERHGLNIIPVSNCTGIPGELNIDKHKQTWYTKIAFTHREDRAMLESNQSALRGLARRVMPVDGIALCF